MRPPQSWQTARVTLILAVLTAAAWGLAALLRAQDWAIGFAGFVPASVSMAAGAGGLPAWLTPLSATLVHGGLLHLGLNLLIFVFCGRSVEGVIGPAAQAILYVAGAYAAAAAQWLVSPSDLTPMIGASGAISAIIGAYAMLFGRNRVKVSNPQLALWLNALWLMAAWIGLQLIVGITLSRGGLNIAIAAHVGGFVAGILLANPLLLLRYRKA